LIMAKFGLLWDLLCTTGLVRLSCKSTLVVNERQNTYG
jgi:hypothetical protein